MRVCSEMGRGDEREKEREGQGDKEGVGWGRERGRWGEREGWGGSARAPRCVESEKRERERGREGEVGGGRELPHHPGAHLGVKIVCA